MRKKIPFLVFLVLIFFALDGFAEVERIQSSLISGDLSSAEKESQGILSGNPDKKSEEKARFYLGMINLKRKNLAEARRNFNILINNFPQSSLLNRARLGIADTYLEEENYSLAEKIYLELLALKDKNVGSTVYTRLITLNLKQGYRHKAQEYLDALHGEYPKSFEANAMKTLPERAMAEETPAVTAQQGSGREIFTVQVGAFSDKSKADRLCQELIEKGENAYLLLLEDPQGGLSLYRVRVGRFSYLQQAEALAKRLSSQGYPTKIFP